MGELLMFRPRRGRSWRSRDPASNGAQIMFFTGVRYERMSEAAPALGTGSSDPKPAAEGKGRARRRKRG